MDILFLLLAKSIDNRKIIKPPEEDPWRKLANNKKKRFYSVRGRRTLSAAPQLEENLRIIFLRQLSRGAFRYSSNTVLWQWSRRQCPDSLAPHLRGLDQVLLSLGSLESLSSPCW